MSALDEEIGKLTEINKEYLYNLEILQYEY